ncbi:hypothetical protein AB0C71_24505 [Streptomyces anulatus]|uniref:hypothetical protein n=1 Tax=Streptomyces anulatus TaxID=1892 RepID=UPI0033E7861E
MKQHKAAPGRDARNEVGHVLSGDPTGIYDQCDEATRGHYRAVVDELARWSGQSAVDVARAAVRLAGVVDGGGPRHVGEYLLGKGRREVETALGCRPPLTVRWVRRLARHAVAVYIGVILAVAVVVAGLSAWGLAAAGVHPAVVTVAVICLVPMLTCFGREVLHALIGSTVPPPGGLPSLARRSEAVRDARVCVVYPVIVHTQDDIAELAATMAANHEANPGLKAVHFALVDLADAATRHTDQDDDLRRLAEETVHSLGESTNGEFQVLFRGRRWNEADGLWMGWERKRGKLTEFNGLILGEGATDFEVPENTAAMLRDIDFVITLDLHSLLPDRGAERLVASLLHPLNRARTDASSSRLVSGHAMLQPRHVPALSAPHTFYHQYVYGMPLPAASLRLRPSMYQRLFKEDFFLGQGIYEARVFHHALEGRIPENSVLSHDKLEGMHAGANAVPGIVMHDDGAAGYREDRHRFHRWIRGDFHLLPWILGSTAGGRRRMSALHRWMMLDDLMSHLRLVSATLSLVLCWMVAGAGFAAVWTFCLTLLLAESIYLRPLVVLFGRKASVTQGRRNQPFSVEARKRLHAAVTAVRMQCVRWALTGVFMLDRSIISLDAAARAIRRTRVGRGVLQWASSATVSRSLSQGTSRPAWKDMWRASAIAVGLLMLVAFFNRTALLPAAPFLIAWVCAPQVAYLSSLPRKEV